MSVLHQPADDIAAHPPQADHADLHFEVPYNSIQITLRFRVNVSAVEVGSLSRGERGFGLTMKRNPSPGAKHRPLRMGEVIEFGFSDPVVMTKTLVQRILHRGIEHL